jgi:hypothetical protein
MYICHKEGYNEFKNAVFLEEVFGDQIVQHEKESLQNHLLNIRSFSQKFSGKINC